MPIPIDSHYIPAFSIEDVLLDKDTGAPLAGGLVYFEQDDQRGVLKPVYQITGTSPNYSFIQLPNPITLSSIGTFEDALDNPVIPYFYPYDADGNVELYYVRVTSFADVPQFDREAQPYVNAQSDDSVLSVITNELSNPQFAQVFFDTSAGAYTYNFNTVADSVVFLAPDWDLIVSAPGVGTVTVEQVTPAGSLNIVTNPATILTISSAGLTKLQLRQRIYGSPNLWGSGFLAATFVAKTFNGTAVSLNMFYSQSNGIIVDQQLVSATLAASGAYTAYPGSASIGGSTSSETYPGAYIDIYFDIPLSIEVGITSVMVAFTGLSSVSNISYDQESNARQIDHLFHDYKPLLEFKPIPSMLVGWDFPLNPAQDGSTASIVPTPQYIWDQTICGSTLSTIAVVRNTLNGAFQATTSVDNEAFYMLQYLTGQSAFNTTINELSVNLRAYQLTHPNVVARVYLYFAAAGGTIPTLPTTIGTIAGSGVFTLTAANWAIIPQPLGFINTFQFGSPLAFINDYKSIGWEGEQFASSTTSPSFAIVVTFKVPTAGTSVIVNSISCVEGNIATIPSPQTPDEVLRECQYYYEKSYAVGTPPGTVTTVGERYALNELGTRASVVATDVVYLQSLSLTYDQHKRVTVTPTFYSPASASVGFMQGRVLRNGADIIPSGAGALGTSPQNYAIAKWTFIGNSPKGLVLICNDTSTKVYDSGASVLANEGDESMMLYHYVANARLGIV